MRDNKMGKNRKQWLILLPCILAVSQISLSNSNSNHGNLALNKITRQLPENNIGIFIDKNSLQQQVLSSAGPTKLKKNLPVVKVKNKKVDENIKNIFVDFIFSYQTTSKFLESHANAFQINKPITELNKALQNHDYSTLKTINSTTIGKSTSEEETFKNNAAFKLSNFPPCVGTRWFSPLTAADCKMKRRRRRVTSSPDMTSFGHVFLARVGEVICATCRLLQLLTLLVLANMVLSETSRTAISEKANRGSGSNNSKRVKCPPQFEVPPRPPTLLVCSCLALALTMLLLQCGDVESNPGPPSIQSNNDPKLKKECILEDKLLVQTSPSISLSMDRPENDSSSTWNCNVPKFLDPGMFAMFSDIVYGDCEKLKDTNIDGWQLFKVAKNEQVTNGYYGAAFWHAKNRHMLITHRGVDPCNIGEVKADLETSVLIKSAAQISSACTFVEDIRQRIVGKNIQLFITGHSLGGLLAQITTASAKYLQLNMVTKKFGLQNENRELDSFHPHTVVFESPGCKEILTLMQDSFDVNLFGRVCDYTKLDITVYLNQPNIINTCGSHVGNILGLSKNDGEIIKSVSTHTIKNFLSEINFETDFDQIIEWPTHDYPNVISSKILNTFRQKSFPKVDIITEAKYKDYDEKDVHFRCFTISELNLLQNFYTLKKLSLLSDDAKFCLPNFEMNLKSQIFFHVDPDYFIPLVRNNIKMAEYYEDEIIAETENNVTHYVSLFEKKATDEIVKLKEDSKPFKSLQSIIGSEKHCFVITPDRTKTWCKIIQQSDQKTNYLMLNFSRFLCLFENQSFQKCLKTLGGKLLLKCDNTLDFNRFIKDTKYLSSIGINNIIYLMQISDSTEIINKLNQAKYTKLTFKVDKLLYSDLHTETQEYILQKEIIFQGINCKLQDILNSEDIECMNTFDISNLFINGKSSIIGTALNSDFDYVVPDLTCPTLNISDSEIPKLKGAMVSNYEEFTAKINEDKNQKSVYLTKEVAGKCILVHASGNMRELSNYFDDKNTVDYTCQDLFDEHKERKIILLSADPGMGKSAFLSEIAKNYKIELKDYYVLKINFNQISHILRKYKENSSKEIDILNFIIDCSGLKTELEKSILNHFIKSTKKLVLFLDAFDEVPTDLEQFSKNLLTSILSLKFYQLWVSTRPHKTSDLETILDAKTFELKPLSEEKQKLYFQRVWLGRHMNAAEKIIQRLEKLRKKTNVQICGIPLQLKMLSEIFECVKCDNETDCNDNDCCLEDSEKSVLDSINHFTIFKLYMYIKLNEYCSKNNHISDEHKDIIESHMDHIHELLAKKVLFPEDSIEMKFLYGISTAKYCELNSFGLCTGCTDSECRFLQRTFAEYFYARYITNQLRSIRDDDDYLFKTIPSIPLDNKESSAIITRLITILTKSQYKVIRAFVDGFLKVFYKNMKLSDKFITIFNNKLESNNLKSDFVLQTCCSENLVYVLNFLKKVLPDEKFSKLLKNSCSNPNDEKSDEKITPLHYSSYYGNAEISQLLIHFGAKIDAIDNMGRTPLHYASLNGHNELCKILIDLKANVDTKDKIGATPVQLSIEGGCIDTFKTLINNNIDINSTDINKRSLLHIAVAKLHENTEEIIKTLIKFNKNNITLKDKDGKTPLHIACFNGNYSIISLLIDNGAQVDVEDNTGDTPLHAGASSQCMEKMKDGTLKTVTILLDKNARVNVLNKIRQTPLHLAVISNSLGIVKLLLKNNADLSVTDKNGNTAMDLAEKLDDKDIAIFFQNYTNEIV